jgi:site-specific recombinase XerD
MNVSAIRVAAAPSITIFVRHSGDCPHAGNEFYKRCGCSKHLRWSYGGRQFRQSAKTRTWSIAEERRHEIEARFKAADPINPVGTVTVEAVTRQTIERAVELFISDKRTQGLDAGFLKKYERELGRLAEFMTAQSRFFPHEMTLEDFTEFRAGWKDTYPSSTTRSKVQERLRSFLRYCYAARLIDRIPQLSSIRIEAPPTMPLSDSEYKKLLKAIPNEFEGDKAKRIDALIQLMRHSGLAIQDAVTLERTELKKDRGKELYRIVTSRQKTGTHVSVPIRSEIAKELIVAMKLNGNPRYVFWQTGNGKVKTVLSNWGNDLRRLFRAAGFPEGHPHQLRDTFAVGLLEKGVPLEEVSKLLGHESIKTTEKHYAPWVKARQDRLDSVIVATWTREKKGHRAKVEKNLSPIN